MNHLLIVMVLLTTPHLPCYLVLSKFQLLAPWLALGCQAVDPHSRSRFSLLSLLAGHILILFHVWTPYWGVGWEGAGWAPGRGRQLSESAALHWFLSAKDLALSLPREMFPVAPEWDTKHSQHIQLGIAVMYRNGRNPWTPTANK